MNTADELVRSLFQKESLNDCSLEELRAIATQYPYFTPVQLLLAEKLKSSNEVLYKEKVQTLSLHFNNPLWLDFLLNGYQTETVEKPADEKKRETVAEENLTLEEPKILQPESESASNALENNIDTDLNAHDLVAEKDSQLQDQENLEIAIDEERAESVNNEPVNQEANDVLESDPNLNEPVIDLVEEKQTDTGAPVEESEGRSENSQPVVEENANENGNISTEIHDEERPGMAEETEETVTETEEEQMAEPDEDTNETPLSIHLPDLNAEPTGNEISFEPYHTIDYFASQGIKFISEEKPADRFGQQLRSFTDWLKAMKRLPEAEVTKLSDLPSEEKVQQLASHSLNEKEIVTETMAEVWLKQGNKEKAIEIYNKLSLLDPPKSAYFASLAEQLKNS